MKSYAVNAPIDPILHAKLREVARKRGENVAVVVRELLSKSLGVPVIHPAHGGARRRPRYMEQRNAGG